MQMRCLIYLSSAAAEDEEVQKKGIVGVLRVGPRCTRILLDDPSAVKIPLHFRFVWMQFMSVATKAACPQCLPDISQKYIAL
jgi:hypothetical protein